MQARTFLTAIFPLALFAATVGCYDRTITKPGPVVPPAATPPIRVDANIKLDDFQKLCNFVPEEGDQRSESGSDESGKTVQIVLGTSRRRQNPSSVRMGCIPGATFVFKGPELRLEKMPGT